MTYTEGYVILDVMVHNHCRKQINDLAMSAANSFWPWEPIVHQLSPQIGMELRSQIWNEWIRNK